MITVHQNFMDNEPDSYLGIMKTIQYDITYGDHYWYGGASIAREDEMSYGVEPVVIDGWQMGRGNLFVLGHHFTPDAEIYINGSSRNTIYVSDEMLLVPDQEFEDGDALEVRFYGADGVLLFATVLPQPEEEPELPPDENEVQESDGAAETDSPAEPASTQETETDAPDAETDAAQPADLKEEASSDSAESESVSGELPAAQ